MKLKKVYTFLYMPDSHGLSRQFRVPRWMIVSGLCSLGVLCGLSLLSVVGLNTGTGWVPGGSRLERENLALEGRIAGLEANIGLLRSELDDVQDVQNLVAETVNLPPLDAAALAAGVGGRGHLDYTDLEVPGLREALAGEGRYDQLGAELQQMVRQARIQRQAYEALLDTFRNREGVRARIPSIRPVDTGWLSSRFGFRNDPFTGKETFHRGLDFSVRLGSAVRVTGDGKVVAVQQQRGLGRLVKVDHGGGVMTVYGHLSKPLVKKGQRVKRGEIIAESGNSGRSTAPHLHYEIRIGGRPVNPLTYILDSYAGRG